MGFTKIMAVLQLHEGVESSLEDYCVYGLHGEEKAVENGHDVKHSLPSDVHEKLRKEWCSIMR